MRLAKGTGAGVEAHGAGRGVRAAGPCMGRSTPAGRDVWEGAPPGSPGLPRAAPEQSSAVGAKRGVATPNSKQGLTSPTSNDFNFNRVRNL